MIHAIYFRGLFGFSQIEQKNKSGRQDSNLRPLGPKPSALPSWATSRSLYISLGIKKTTRPRGVEPLTFWSVVKHSIQLSYGRITKNAEDRNRTGTVITHRRILSPVRLPVPPPRHNSKAENGFRTRDPHLGKVVLYHWAISA